MNTKLLFPLIILLLAALFVVSFFLYTPEKQFPYLGFRQAIQKEVNGQTVIDTVYHTTAEFALFNQDSVLITEKVVEGKVFIADVFFTHCPTICPKVKKQMKRVYEVYKDNPDFVILSYSIDGKRDTVGRLAWFAERMRINKAKSWHLLTGPHEEMARIGQSYLLAVAADEESPGGFDHSGLIMLMDRERHIRGNYDGTDPKAVDELIKDIQLLLDQ